MLQIKLANSPCVPAFIRPSPSLRLFPAANVQPSPYRTQAKPTQSPHPTPASRNIHASVPSSPSLSALPALPPTHAVPALIALPSLPASPITGAGAPRLSSPTPALVTSHSPPTTSRRPRPGPSAMINPSATCHPVHARIPSAPPPPLLSFRAQRSGAEESRLPSAPHPQPGRTAKNWTHRPPKWTHPPQK